MLELGIFPGGVTDPIKIAWWWTTVRNLYLRFRGIREAAGMDPEKMLAPKNIWMDDKEISLWFEDRERLRENRA